MAKTARARRILVVDDNALMRQSIASRIERDPTLTVCTAVASVAEALQAVSQLHPDLVVTDLALPDEDGFCLIQELRARRPDLPILVFSMHKASFFAGRAQHAGATAYLTKGEDTERLLPSIRTLLQGGRVRASRT